MTLPTTSGNHTSSSRLAEIRAGDVEPREFRHADGSTMVYSVTALSGGKRLLCYYDISEMKRREAELAETLERSRLAESVVNSVKDPIFVKDDNLRFVFVNEAFAALFGKKPTDMLGRSGGDFLPAELAATFEASERQVLETGERYEVEEDFEFDGIGRSRVVRKNRVSMDSGKDYIACFVFDITEMKRRETEAEEARRRLADVLESLPAGVIIYDRDDRFVLANRKLKDAMPALAPFWVPGTPLARDLAGRACGRLRPRQRRSRDRRALRSRSGGMDRELCSHGTTSAIPSRSGATRTGAGSRPPTCAPMTAPSSASAPTSPRSRSAKRRCAGACARSSSSAMCSTNCRWQPTSSPTI